MGVGILVCGILVCGIFGLWRGNIVEGGGGYRPLLPLAVSLFKLV